MILSKRLALVALLGLVSPAAASAQVMRFNTNMGSFDMTLNPTNDPNLQPLVDNIVAYIGLGRYSYTAINRAVDDFVLQMGGFEAFPPDANQYLEFVNEVETLDPVVVDANNDRVVDFTTLSNTRGTVSLALSGQPANPNSGTCQFFINLNDNSNLNTAFVPFARIDDLTTVERIMGLNIVDLTGGGDNSPFDTTPLLDDDHLVVLKSVRVLQATPEFSFVGPVAAALEQIRQDELAADALAASAPAAASSLSSSAASATPEPSSLALAAMGVLAAGRLRFRRRR